MSKENLFEIIITGNMDTTTKLLPFPNEDLESEIEDYFFKNEYSIMFTHKFKNEDNITLQHLLEINETLQDFHFGLVKGLFEYYGCLFQTVSSLQEGRFLFQPEISDLKELAAQLVEEGYFGSIPERVLGLINYQKVARELEIEGWRVLNGYAIFAY